jgi:hypothetical protein
MDKVKSGVMLLISGRIDADEHWLPDSSRIQDLKIKYSHGLLSSREAEIVWPEGPSHLSYSRDITTYGERGFAGE